MWPCAEHVRHVPLLSLEKTLPDNATRAAIAQLGERQTEDLKVPGLIPGLGRDLRKQSGAGDASCPLSAPHSHTRSQPALGARLKTGRYGSC